MNGHPRFIITILCLLLLAPMGWLAAQSLPVEEPEPLPAVEAPAAPRPATPRRQPTPPRNAAQLPQATPAQPAAAPAAPSAGEAERLLNLLQDDARRAELIRAAFFLPFALAPAAAL